MITQVDDALCRLIGGQLPAGTAVRLDAPKPTWQTEADIQSVDLFLFGLRDAGESGAQPGKHCALTYLVTARAGKVHEEHLLLQRALCAVIGTEFLPDHLLPDGFDGQVSVRIADLDPTRLWTSLGMPARAAFVLTVTVPVAELTGS
ncbi:Pvc16 family protein [Amycolatopsis sp. cg5]|uniref:Pvc16 family protein n=1 Tax=Amycolatopsis sp. cg5 TaxID=3238802 RepID=UPI003525C7B5